MRVLKNRCYNEDCIKNCGCKCQVNGVDNCAVHKSRPNIFDFKQACVYADDKKHKKPPIEPSQLNSDIAYGMTSVNNITEDELKTVQWLCEKSLNDDKIIKELKNQNRKLLEKSNKMALFEYLNFLRYFIRHNEDNGVIKVDDIYKEVEAIESGKKVWQPNEGIIEHNRQVREHLLCDILSTLYFQDYNRQCDYENMTAEEVVKAQHKVLGEIEEKYNYHLSDDILP